MAKSAQQQLAAGENAPAFSAIANDGSTLDLGAFTGKYVVLYFYPKDNTPGCTIEAREFRDALDEFEAENTVVVGVSPDSRESHCAFIDRFDLNFPLLVDEDHVLAEQFGVWVEKNMYGRKYMGVQRATFLIDPDGVIVYTWPRVRPEGHAQQVLRVLRTLRNEAAREA